MPRATAGPGRPPRYALLQQHGSVLTFHVVYGGFRGAFFHERMLAVKSQLFGPDR